MCHFTFLLTHSLSFFDRLSLFLSTLSFLDCPFFLVCFSSLIGRPLDWFWKWFYDGRVSFYFYVFFSAFFFLFGTFLCHPSFRRPFDFTLFGSSFFFCFVGCWLCVSLFIFFLLFLLYFFKKILGPFSRLGTIFRKAPGSYLIDRFICNTHNISSVDFRFSFWLSSQGPRMFYWVLPSFFLASRGYCPKWFWLLPSFFFNVEFTDSAFPETEPSLPSLYRVFPFRLMGIGLKEHFFGTEFSLHG